MSRRALLPDTNPRGFHTDRPFKPGPVTPITPWHPSFTSGISAAVFGSVTNKGLGGGFKTLTQTTLGTIAGPGFVLGADLLTDQLKTDNKAWNSFVQWGPLGSIYNLITGEEAKSLFDLLNDWTKDNPIIQPNLTYDEFMRGDTKYVDDKSEPILDPTTLITSEPNGESKGFGGF